VLEQAALLSAAWAVASTPPERTRPEVRGSGILVTMDVAQLRRWIARFEAIAEADRAALRRQRQDPEEVVRLALGLIDAAREAARAHPALERLREADAEPVRATWVLLRKRLRRA
jgi:hypothetical protein